MLIVHKETVELDYDLSPMYFEDAYFTGIFMKWRYKGNNVMISAKNKQTVADLFFGDEKKCTWDVLLNGKLVDVGSDVTEFVKEVILTTHPLYRYYKAVKTAVHEFGCMEMHIKSTEFGPNQPFYGYFETAIEVNNDGGSDDINLIIIEQYFPKTTDKEEYEELTNDIERFSHRHPSVNVHETYLIGS